MAAKDEAKRKQQDPLYTVVRVGPADSGPVFAVVGERRAKTQEKACDTVVENLAFDQRTGSFAAFLTDSWREFDYETEQHIVTKSSPRGSSIRPS